MTIDDVDIGFIGHDARTVALVRAAVEKHLCIVTYPIGCSGAVNEFKVFRSGKTIIYDRPENIYA